MSHILLSILSDSIFLDGAMRPERLRKFGVRPLGELLELKARGHGPIY